MDAARDTARRDPRRGRRTPDGRIQDGDSYDRNPFLPRDKKH